MVKNSRGNSHVINIFMVLAVAGIPLTALAPSVLSGLSPGVAMSTLMLFTTIRVATHYRIVLWIVWTVVACVVSAPFLMEISSIDHTVSMRTGVAYVSELLFAAVSILTILWSRLRIGTAWTAAAYASGMLVQQALTPDAWSTNAWKYAFAWPIAVLLLAIIHKSNKRLATLFAFAILGYASMINDYRSFFGFCIMAAAIHFWSSLRQKSMRSSIPFFVALIALGYFIYQSAIWLAVNGYLGNRNQTVTMEQIGSSGSALAGARSEIFAAIPLFLSRPIGFGPGVAPNASDIDIGLNGLTAAGVEINFRYAYEYMFGEVFKLHSIISDLWVIYGLAGLLLAAIFTIVILRGAATGISNNQTTGLHLLLVITGLWNLGLSPIGSNLDELILSVALLVHPDGARTTTRYVGTDLQKNGLMQEHIGFNSRTPIPRILNKFRN